MHNMNCALFEIAHTFSIETVLYLRYRTVLLLINHVTSIGKEHPHHAIILHNSLVAIL